MVRLDKELEKAKKITLRREREKYMEAKRNRRPTRSVESFMEEVIEKEIQDMKEEERKVYACKECGSIIKVNNGVIVASCSSCGSHDIEVISGDKERSEKIEEIDKVKDELYKLIGKEELETEGMLEKLSDKYGHKVSALRKQLNAYKKEEEEQEEGISIPIKEYTQEDVDYAREKFKDTNLLEEINKELSIKHLGDDNQKMTIFLGYVSGLQPNKNLSITTKVSSVSAGGKDNIQRTCLGCVPRESHLWVTSATSATLQDDIKHFDIIGFSEINLFREGGANRHLLETIKQITEGGSSSLKKDKRTDNKKVRFEQDKQKAVSFGTTDIKDDEELGTRYLTVPISINEEKIKVVNHNTFDTFSDPEKMLGDVEEKDNWVRVGLSMLRRNTEELNVYIPYSKLLKEKVNGVDIFDNKNPRSQRDLKRILNLTCAMTWLMQEQREIKTIKDKKFIVSEPIDLINVLKISGEFFDQTYFGMDMRVSAVLKSMEKLRYANGDEWVARDLIQKDLGITKNTITKYCNELSEAGLITGNKGSALTGEAGGHLYDYNKAYYKKVEDRGSKQGFKKGSKAKIKGSKRGQKHIINVDLDDLEDFLLEKNSDFTHKYDVISSPEKNFSIKVGKNLTPSNKIDEKAEKEVKIDPFLTPSKQANDPLLTPSKLPLSEIDPLTEESALANGYTKEEVKEYLEASQ